MRDVLKSFEKTSDKLLNYLLLRLVVFFVINHPVVCLFLGYFFKSIIMIDKLLCTGSSQPVASKTFAAKLFES